jgi:ubiquitin-protein ligase
MDPRRQKKILLNQFTIAKKDIEQIGIENVNLIPYINEKNIYIWYFLIKGLGDAYEGGKYLFKLTAPKTFPQKPPSFEFLTPNGVFDLGGPICISVGEFHSNDHKKGSSGEYGWRPALGMMGFAIQVLNGLITFDENDHGIRIINTTYEQKQDYAKKSIQYNIDKNMDIYSNFIDIIETNTSELIETNTSELIETNTSELIETNTSELIETNTSELIETNTSELIETNTSELIETNTSELIEIFKKKIDILDECELSFDETRLLSEDETRLSFDNTRLSFDNTSDDNISDDNISDDITTDCKIINFLTGNYKL